MKRNDLILAILLVAATAAAYWPAYRGQFIWDDERHVSENLLLRTPQGLSTIWTSPGATPQYYPLTHTTFWIEWQLWQDHVLGYHVTNVLLHIVASLLVVGLMRRLALPGAWLAGFLFALHPIHVESVAWISERKNTLSIVLALASLIVFPAWRRQTEADAPDAALERRRWWIGWSLSFFFYLGAVLSKTVTCTLPAVVLVLLWWKNGRITRRDVLAMLPYLVIAAAAAWITGDMERTVVGAEGEDWLLSPLERLLIASRAVWWYLLAFLCPWNLAFQYERWTPGNTDALGWLGLAGIVIVLALAWAGRHRIGRGLLAGLLIFGGTLFPALGFFNLYPHRFSFVADHFQYHSDVALVALLASLAGLAHLRWPRVTVGLAIAVLGAAAVATCLQTRIYRDHETLWRDTIAKTPTSWLAYHNLGLALAYGPNDNGRWDEALRAFDRVRQLRPQHDRVDWSTAELLTKLGRTDEAAAAYARAEALYRSQIGEHPQAINPYARLGSLYEQIGRDDEALALYMAASNARPDVGYFAEGASTGLMKLRRYDEAIVYLQRWIDRRPNAVLPRVNLASSYFNTGRLMDARRTLLEAARIAPNDPGVRAGLDRVQYELTRPPATAPAPAAATRPG